MQANPNLMSGPWRQLKLRILKRFPTITAAAHKLGVHPNSLRQLDRCPDLKKRLNQALRAPKGKHS